MGQGKSSAVLGEFESVKIVCQHEVLAMIPYCQIEMGLTSVLYWGADNRRLLFYLNYMRFILFFETEVGGRKRCCSQCQKEVIRINEHRSLLLDDFRLRPERSFQSSDAMLESH